MKKTIEFEIFLFDIDARSSKNVFVINIYDVTVIDVTGVQ